MDKIYTRIDEKPKLGSDFADWTIFPSLVEAQVMQITEKENEYIMQKLMEFKIDSNVLENQLREIYRLNEAVRKLEDALDKACNLIGEYMNCPLGVYDKQYPFCKGWECDNNSARCWKEWLLKEVQK